MKQESTIRTLEFKAILLKEVLLFFIIHAILFYVFMEYILVPLTGKHFFRLTIILFIILEFLFHKKRAKDFIVSFSKDNIIENIEFKNDIYNKNQIQNLSIVKFLFKKTYSNFLILNRQIILVYIKEMLLAPQPSKENKELANSKNKQLFSAIANSKYPQNKLKIIPKVINTFFYLLLFMALGLVIFMLAAVFTSNTHWFNYFK